VVRVRGRARTRARGRSRIPRIPQSVFTLKRGFDILWDRRGVVLTHCACAWRSGVRNHLLHTTGGRGTAVVHADNPGGAHT
jgi:hypothetical protein